jgi:hypothetical protein
MRVVATIDDVGQDGLLAINIQGQCRGVTQPLLASLAQTAAAQAQSTTYNNLNGTSMGSSPRISTNPMGL